jgi:nickel-dependent lactate racemase
MANYNKNIFVGTGGAEGINKSHFLGAAYGMERIMGRVDSPVRKILNYASENFASHLPIVYVQTVLSKNNANKLQLKGLFVGDDDNCYKQAAELSIKLNFQTFEKPLKKVVVYLDPSEYKSTWLGNKSIYRTRMALADNGELIVLAPGVKKFGEDIEIDRLIRKYGYFGTENTLNKLKVNSELENNLSAAAHLIHGSSENRFKITYCVQKLNKKEIENVGYNYMNYKEAHEIYPYEKLKDGLNIANNEEFFYISNPALGLWAWEKRIL